MQAAAWLTRVLPLRVQLWLADTAASAGWRVLPAMHGRVRDNVQVILRAGASDEEIERVARVQWRNYLRYLRDFVALGHAGTAEMEQAYADAQGLEHVQAALAAGKGMVLASAHFGNWDYAGGALGGHYPVNVIADVFSSKRFDRLVNRYRTALRLKVIPIDKALMRTLTALRRNEIVAFLIDKPLPGDAGVEVEFFGRVTRIPAGAAFFAAKSGAPIVPGFMWRGPDRRFEARVFPPIWVRSTAEVQAAMQQMVRRLEQMIAAHPEQWYMFRSMWPAVIEQRPALVLESEAVA
ncbi:MAG TPA: lysophospholipid acyltransferase family protein [Chloroflexota bacterium]|nr:lysophospholipid acyltransferase family protein [Chloroflexota bacterium]